RSAARGSGINGGAVEKQGVSECRAAVVLQQREAGIASDQAVAPALETARQLEAIAGQNGVEQIDAGDINVAESRAESPSGRAIVASRPSDRGIGRGRAIHHPERAACNAETAATARATRATHTRISWG